MPNKLHTVVLACCSLLSISLLSACSDSGGGSGDTNNANNNDAAVQAVAPFVGTWDLPDDWRGDISDQTNDEAYFVVRTPDSDGVAVAIIYDLDDSIPGAERNCFIISGLPGTVEQSVVSEDVFLEISEYPTAIVSLSAAGSLEIAVFSEGAGSDGIPERTLSASRLGVLEQDIQLCDS